MSVDLPQPDGPISETNSPAAISRSMPLSAPTAFARLPKVFSTPTARTAGTAASASLVSNLMRPPPRVGSS